MTTINKTIEKYILEFEYNKDNDVFGEDAEHNTRNTLVSFASEIQPKSVYMLYQYDQWFSNDSKVLFGIFTDKTFDEVKEIAMDGFEKFYKDFKNDVYSNGKNQWLNDKHNFGFSIEKVENINIFEEM